MPKWNFVKGQLKFDKPRNLFTKTHKPETKIQMFYDKSNELFMYLIVTKIIINMKQWSELHVLSLTTFSMTLNTII